MTGELTCAGCGLGSLAGLGRLWFRAPLSCDSEQLVFWGMDGLVMVALSVGRGRGREGVWKLSSGFLGFLSFVACG